MLHKAITKSIKYLSQKEAQLIDEELMNPSKYGFSLDQLMEMAGMSVSHVVAREFPSKKNILIAVGPGNNGLVCARHLQHFGYKCTIVMPKQPTKGLYVRLCKQCTQLGIPFVSALENQQQPPFDVIVDGIFGFSFQGPVKSPYHTLIAQLNAAQVPIVAIDVPSGWDIEKGPTECCIEQAQVLISLTAPKLCAKHFTGKHYVGGRFVPFGMAQELQLNLPDYPGTDIIVPVHL